MGIRRKRRLADFSCRETRSGQCLPHRPRRPSIRRPITAARFRLNAPGMSCACATRRSNSSSVIHIHFSTTRLRSGGSDAYPLPRCSKARGVNKKMSCLIKILLMLFAIEVIDRLHGVKGGKGHFYEHRAPVAHRAVPKTGQFKRLEFLTVLTL